MGSCISSFLDCVFGEVPPSERERARQRQAAAQEFQMALMAMQRERGETFDSYVEGVIHDGLVQHKLPPCGHFTPFQRSNQLPQSRSNQLPQSPRL